jgi:hypothetical protein
MLQEQSWRLQSLAFMKPIGKNSQKRQMKLLQFVKHNTEATKHLLNALVGIGTCNGTMALTL